MHETYIGRFAPSPTGFLHIGSLLTAVASYVDARANNGRWLLRMEDLDPPREVAGAADAILRTLEAFSLYWDGEVVYQSQRHHLYREALSALQEKNLIYPCFCSRTQIRQTCQEGVDGLIYSGHCRHLKNPDFHLRHAYRIKTADSNIAFHDACVGDYVQNLAQSIGDFVLLRADGLWAYQLAVVVDDGEQKITHIVRGKDLLVSTPRQIYLQQCLNLATPHYAHLPLLTNKDGQKWSKQTKAPPLKTQNKEKILKRVLQYLMPHQDIPDDDCPALLSWASSVWDIHQIPIDPIQTEEYK